MNFIKYLYEEHHLLLLTVICVLGIAWCVLLVTYPAITIGGTSGLIVYRLIQAYKQYRKEYDFN